MRLLLFVTCGLGLLLCSCGGVRSSSGSNPNSPAPSPSEFQVSVAFHGTGTGAVLSNPSGISCHTGASGACSISVAAGSRVKLTVVPDPLMVFAGWNGGGCQGTSSTCTFAVNTNTNIAVTLNPAPPPPPANAQLTVTLSGNGQGQVTTNPTGISCPGTCTASFPTGTQLMVTATPAAGSVFAGYSGACTTQTSKIKDYEKSAATSSPAPTCSFAASGTEALTAAFTTAAPPPPPPPPASQISVTISPSPFPDEASGTVVSNPAGISCPGTCSASFAQGTTVTLTAAGANAGWKFKQWGGDGSCSGTNTTCSIAMGTKGDSVAANFTSPDMEYHGGPVLARPVTQAIFWGPSWGSSSFAGDKISGLDSWYTGISGSSYAGSLDEYSDVTGDKVSAQSTYAGHVIDTSTVGTDGTQVAPIIKEACSVGTIVPDGYYAIYTDVPRPPNGTVCAWHSYGICSAGSSNTTIEVAFFYNLDNDPSCNSVPSANTRHSVGLAALSNMSGHELSETRSDPFFSAWFGGNGTSGEVGDLCDWAFGPSPVTFSDGSQWTIQLNWSNDANDNGKGEANGGCIDFDITGGASAQ